MEKAFNRQKVLLAHLQPTSPSPLLSVSLFSFLTVFFFLMDSIEGENGFHYSFLVARLQFVLLGTVLHITGQLLLVMILWLWRKFLDFSLKKGRGYNLNQFLHICFDVYFHFVPCLSLWSSLNLLNDKQCVPYCYLQSQAWWVQGYLSRWSTWICIKG